MGKYNVHLSKRADEMLLSHTEFLSRVSTTAARRLLSDFTKETKRIKANPFLFPFADDLDVSGIPPETYRKCMFDKRYKLIFIIEDSYVFIDAIIDCRQENANLFAIM